MKVILQRVCWNTRGWILPSGSTFENAFPGEEGYAHEEWNFQLEDQVDGYIFPYTYSSPDPNKIGGLDAPFKVVLFTQQPVSNRWLIVGVYHDARLMDEADYAKVLPAFEQRGIFKRRASELQSVADQFNSKNALKEVKDAFKKKYVKIKVEASSVEIFATPREIKKPSNHRFTTFTYIDEVPSEAQRVPAEHNEPLLEDGYPRETGAALHYIIPRHNKLSNALATHLRELGAIVRQESGNVDLEFELRGQTYLAELKVTLYSTIRHSIREAVGQLLEYNLYPGRQRKDRWLIVLDKEPSGTDQQYIAILRDSLALPIFIGWYSDLGFRFEESISDSL